MISLTPMNSEHPFTLVHQPADLPTHAQISLGAPHLDSVYAVGFAIDADWVETAYQRGLFPWYNEGEPVLWHSPEPRMVLALDEFKISQSLHKRLNQWARQPALGYRVTLNRCFDRVISACSETPRAGQDGTWIHSALKNAYIELHRRQRAVSVELWQHDQLVAGLYGVLIGKMFFGESMFTHVSDGSKVALACWVQCLREHGGQWIDCQQVTAHLTRLGARPLAREVFFQRSAEWMRAEEINWSSLCAHDNLLNYFGPPLSTNA